MAWSTPPTFTAGATLTASQLNVVSGDLAMFAGARGSYAPSWTNFTTGNGTVTARYRQIDKEVEFFIQVTLGSTSAITGALQFTLPVTAAYTNWAAFGTTYDVSVSSTAGYPIAAEAVNTTTMTARIFPTTAGANFGNLNATTPFTYATGDIITISGRYEAA